MNKYNAKKTIWNGIKFDSKREAEVAEDFFWLMKAKEKKDRVVKVVYQPKFILQESFKDKNGKRYLPIYYIADFKVTYANGYEEIIDVKGYKTEVYNIKKKLFLKKYPEINFREIK